MAAMTDFSQSEEQQHLIAFAKEHGPGRFLDIGAGDGVTFSNTHALTQIGWDGVCVEPSPVLFDNLSALYANGPIYCVNAAVTVNQVGLTDFYYARGHLVSTLKRGHSDHWEVPLETITVMTVTLREILEYFGSFALVSIDTEGSSVDLLEDYTHQGLHWEAVGCICVEAEDEAERKRIVALCDGWKWEVTPNNVILVR